MSEAVGNQNNTKIQRYTPDSSDELFLNLMKPLLPSISQAFGPNCTVSLHCAAESRFPCIAVENGAITGMEIGSDVSPFVADILSEESKQGGKSNISVFYTKTADGHALKSTLSLIRNKNSDLIGCIWISIDLSVPLHDFIRNFIPVVDDNLADSLSDSTEPRPVGDVDNLVLVTLDQAISNASGYRAISATERNKLIVKDLQRRGIFSIRSAVGIVAKELGVSRYTIYNYLKDNSPVGADDALNKIQSASITGK